MKKYILYIPVLIGCMAIMSCADSDLNTASDDNKKQPSFGETYVEVPYREWKNGQFRAWSTADSGETLTLDGLSGYVSTSHYMRTAWGGRSGLVPQEVKGQSGFFCTARIQGRSYLLDPDGGAVILHGIQHVRPGSSKPQTDAFASKFGTDAVWSSHTGELIADNHFNYISYGSARIEAFPAAIRSNLLTPRTQKVAYAENLYLLRSFMWDMKQNLGYTFDDTKYNRLVLLFEPTFPAYIDALVKEKSRFFAGDHHFIGYYLDNELPFASYENAYPLLGIDLKHFLALPDRYKAARTYAQDFLHAAGADEHSITAELQEQFRAAVADYYYRITTEVVHRYDTEHLILGSRLHDWSKYNRGVVEACARYCDAVSINYYARWQPETDYLDKLEVWCGSKPFLVSEFYVKAENASFRGKTYDNKEGGGWMVRNQQARGQFYQNFCLRLLQRKNCVGWVHFEYADGCIDDVQMSNKGIVSLEYEPYNEFLAEMRRINLDIYSLIDYYDDLDK